MAHQDPMTSFEQAEAEADERFFEERDDQDGDESLDYDEARDWERLEREAEDSAERELADYEASLIPRCKW